MQKWHFPVTHVQFWVIGTIIVSKACLSVVVGIVSNSHNLLAIFLIHLATSLSVTCSNLHMNAFAVYLWIVCQMSFKAIPNCSDFLHKDNLQTDLQAFHHFLILEKG